VVDVTLRTDNLALVVTVSTQLHYSVISNFTTILLEAEAVSTLNDVFDICLLIKYHVAVWYLKSVCIYFMYYKL